MTLVTGSPASATTPSRLWWGVERIVVSCDGDAETQKLESAVCAAVQDEVRSRLSRPVMTRAEAKAAGGDLAADLIIKVSARRLDPGTVELTVRPKRIDIMNEAPPALIATVAGPADTPAALAALVAQSLVKILPAN